MTQLGIVIIGRNEGERLRRCLESVKAAAANAPLVYVDSGSSDGSAELARSMDVDVVELDQTSPFTAARARNAGFDRLAQLDPEIQYVQFIDGDCELAPAWLEEGTTLLAKRPELAAVCGRLIEKNPRASVYNRICQIEWDDGFGEVDASGGIVMMHADALRDVGRFDPTIIAGEEPELCFRLRRRGWKIWRSRQEMARHDAAITRFSQWWKRAIRSGHSYAHGAFLHGGGADRYYVRPVLSNWLWGILLPLAAIGLAWVTHGWSLVAFGLYPIQAIRILLATRRRGLGGSDSALYALFCVLAKVPQALGQCVFLSRRLRGSPYRIIEYKGAIAGGDRGGSGAKQRVRHGLTMCADRMGILRLLERRLHDGLTILTYHRVLPEAQCRIYPLPSLAMPAQAFRQQMRWLAANCRVVSIEQWLSGLSTNGCGHRPIIAISFDDGYLDNYEIAAPILDELGLKATFFVTAGLIGSEAALWFDEAAEQWNRLSDAGRLRVTERLSCIAQNRPTTFEQCKGILRHLPDSHRHRFIDALRHETGWCGSSGQYRLMSPDQLRDLHGRGHVVGSHSLTHPLLPCLSGAELEKELCESRRWLSELLGSDVRGLCYPNGDFDSRVVRMARSAGYEYATTQGYGVNQPGRDAMRLRRLHVHPSHVLGRDLIHDESAFRLELYLMYAHRRVLNAMTGN